MTDSVACGVLIDTPHWRPTDRLVYKIDKGVSALSAVQEMKNDIFDEFFPAKQF